MNLLLNSNLTLYEVILPYFSHFTLFRVKCEELFCKTNIKLLKLIKI